MSPNIPRDKKSLKVADIATGTGYEYPSSIQLDQKLTERSVWLLDLQSQLDPSTETELVGFDVDINQVGPKEWLPKSLSLREWSVFADVPDELVGTFDIVNVRLICFVIEEDPAPVLRNLTKLLSKYSRYFRAMNYNVRRS